MQDRISKIRGLFKAAPKDKEPQQTMRTHSDHLSTSAVHQANVEGMKGVSPEKTHSITAKEPLQIRTQLTNNLKDLANQETPERHSHHIVGAQVAQAINNLTSPETKVNSNFHDYVSHAMENHSGNPLVDMLDDVAGDVYSGKKPKNPFQQSDLSEQDTETVLKHLSNKYPGYKHKLLDSYRFGRDSNTSAIQAGQMLNNLRKYHETGKSVYLKAAKSDALSAVERKEIGGKHLPPQTFKMANSLMSGVVPPKEAIKPTNEELDFHMHSDPGMLSYVTSKALAAHHLNRSEEQAKELDPVVNELASLNLESLTPEQLNKYRDKIIKTRNDLGKLSIGNIPAGKKQREILRFKNEEIEKKLGLRKSEDLDSRISYIKEKIKGGKGDNMPDSNFDPKQLEMGMEVEREHSPDPQIRNEISKDHLTENSRYYTKLDDAGLADELDKSILNKAQFENIKRHLYAVKKNEPVEPENLFKTRIEKFKQNLNKASTITGIAHDFKDSSRVGNIVKENAPMASKRDPNRVPEGGNSVLQYDKWGKAPKWVNPS